MRSLERWPWGGLVEWLVVHVVHQMKERTVGDAGQGVLVEGFFPQAGFDESRHDSVLLAGSDRCRECEPEGERMSEVSHDLFGESHDEVQVFQRRMERTSIQERRDLEVRDRSLVPLAWIACDPSGLGDDQ